MSVLLFAFAALLVYMSGLFVVSLITRNNGVADIGYGVAFMVVIGTTAFFADKTFSFAFVLVALSFVWGTRLMVRIFRKNYGKPEDFRYKSWRDAWGKHFIVRSFLQVYMLQGLVVFTVALPVVLALVYRATEPSVTLVVVGIGLWSIGFFFESVGDYQLDRFLGVAQNKGKILMTGLWRYSRHPNYFGESCMWWGIATAATGLTTVPLLPLVSPILITYLLLFVSGVPLLEKRWEGNPEWEAYKSRTSVFIPLLPR